MIERRLPDLRSITCGFFPLHFGRWPPDRRSMIGRCPTGRRQMRKSGEESAYDPANFNCELNLPDRCRMRAQGVLNRRMAIGFLQDSSPGSPHGDPAIDFALLGRSHNVSLIRIFMKRISPVTCILMLDATSSPDISYLTFVSTLYTAWILELLFMVF